MNNPWNVMGPKPTGWFWEGYYEVTMDIGCTPVVLCDDWTTTPEDIWCSYVVFPQEA